MAINERITAARERLNMSKTEFAAAIGISPRDVWRYESGETTKIPPDMLQNMHVKFGIDLNWLICGGEYASNDNQFILAENKPIYNKIESCSGCSEKTAEIVRLKKEIDTFVRILDMLDDKKQSHKAS